MRVALTGGGTGGHILPAMTVLEALRAKAGESFEVRWFGPENRGERAQVEAYGVTFESIPAAAIRGRGPGKVAKSLWQLLRGTIRARSKMHAFDPDVVFSTGGYGSFPGCVAARILRRPLVVYLPDVEPGWAVKAEKRLATRMATTTEAALKFLPKAKTTVTGYPVRSAFTKQTRAEARAALGLSNDERVLVVAGATQGAHAINDAILHGLRTLVEEMVVFHVTGKADFTDAAGYGEALGPDLSPRYHVHPFMDDLPTVMVAADLAVMRSGASTLGELPAAGLPAILVPAGYAGGHQHGNAEWLANGGAAVIMEESALRGLPEQIMNLMGDEKRLAEMSAAARAMAQPDAAKSIAELVMEVARK
jgi:UDP-N-acetylglucosamine--N-acetylmuramyl-(pentapeptide) pyrophosphoryl-undecaprenol N-acetylglucosamine transferase